MARKLYMSLFYHAVFQQSCWNPHQIGHFGAETAQIWALLPLLRISELRRRIEVHMPFKPGQPAMGWFTPISATSKA